MTLIDELLDASQVVTGTLKIERLAVELTLPVQAAVESILLGVVLKGTAVIAPQMVSLSSELVVSAHLRPAGRRCAIAAIADAV